MKARRPSDPEDAQRSPKAQAMLGSIPKSLSVWGWIIIIVMLAAIAIALILFPDMVVSGRADVL